MMPGWPQLMRKMWSSGNFKTGIAPQEFVQEVSLQSKRRFAIGHRADCVDFLLWLGSALASGLKQHGALARSGGGGGGIGVAAAAAVQEPFAGRVQVRSRVKRLVSSLAEVEPAN